MHCPKVIGVGGAEQDSRNVREVENLGSRELGFLPFPSIE